MKKQTFILISIVVVAAVAGFILIKPAPNSVDDSGIRGKATVEPTCPVQRIPPDPRCADKPLKTTFVISSEDNSVKINVNTGEDGSFSVNLRPGKYLISGNPTQMLPRLSPQEVTVQAHQWMDTTLQFDSGMR